MQNLRGCEKIQIIRFGESNKEKIATKKKRKKTEPRTIRNFFLYIFV